MRTTLSLTFAAVGAAILGAAALLLAFRAGGIDDPADAACPRPPAMLAPAHVVLDHREAAVHFTCAGARLAGTLYLPLAAGPHPAVVWLHGSGSRPRLGYGSLVESYVTDGIAFFSYDKRGVGDSEGECCPDEHGHFNLVTADAVGAVAALAASPDVDRARIGYLGASAAGWIAPRAAVESHAAFVAVASPGVLQHDLVARYERAVAGGGEPGEIAERVRSWTPSGFDPTPDLERLAVPALWLFGGADRNLPTAQSVARLRALERERSKNWTIVVYPHAGHGLFDDRPTDPRAIPAAEAWVRAQVRPRPAIPATS